MQTRDPEAARLKLLKEGYAVKMSEDGLLLLSEHHAIANPDQIAKLLVNAHMPPIQLNVEVEGLEVYFLRRIEIEEGTKG